MDMYYYVLHVTNMVLMAAMYVNNLQKKWKKEHFLSSFYNIDHR